MPNRIRKQEHESMDHSTIRQTFEFGQSISTAGKNILNFIQLSPFVAEDCKMWKLLS